MTLELLWDTCVQLASELATVRYGPALMAGAVFLAAGLSITKSVRQVLARR